MPKRFVLDIATDFKSSSAQFRLLDAKTDALLAAHEVHIDNSKAFDWEGIFDTQNHIHRYAGALRPANAESGTEAQLLRILRHGSFGCGYYQGPASRHQ